MQTVDRSLFPHIKSALSDNRVIVITGMRRVGKTTTLRWLLDQVPSDNKLYMDLERLDTRAVFEEQNYELILNYFRNIGLDTSKPLTIALDEIQYVPNLPSVVKYLVDHHGIKFLLTGSSSFYMKNYFSESLSGRKVIYEMFPLGFGEFLDFKQIQYRRRSSWEEMRFDSLEYERLKNYYNEYIEFGGLPSIVLEPRVEVKREILQDIFSSYINIDVQAMADFRKISELQLLLKALAIRIGNKIDITKLSQIVGISRPTLLSYLEFLEKTYVIYQLPSFAGVDRSIALGKKLYFLDNGIASILGNPGEGALFENAVFNQLRSYGALAYLSRGNQYEIDFVLSPADGAPIGMEAKYHPVASDDQKLKRIAEKNQITQSWLIGRSSTPNFENFIWGGLIF